MPEVKPTKRCNLKILETLFDIASYLGLISFPLLTGILMHIAGESFGFWARMAVGILALIGFITVFLRYLYRIGDWFHARHLDEARQKYRGIYRVVALPSRDPQYILEIEKIKVGDFGWEATPETRNGLIYLEGLTADWGMVWKAGFLPDQIEYVGPKSVSQYDWRDFEYDGRSPLNAPEWKSCKPKTACPFPVQTQTACDDLYFSRL